MCTFAILNIESSLSDKCEPMESEFSISPSELLQHGEERYGVHEVTLKVEEESVAFILQRLILLAEQAF